MARNLKELLARKHPEFSNRFALEWRRVFQGGIDVLTPRQELKSFSGRVLDLAKASFSPEMLALKPVLGRMLLRAMSSQRRREKLYRWLRDQLPGLFDVPSGDLFLHYLEQVEVSFPGCTLALSDRQRESTLAAVLERRFADVLTASGEAQWSLLKDAQADLAVSYEATLDMLVRAESARCGASVLKGKKATFGNKLQSLIESMPNEVAQELDQHAHKIRNAFLHGRASFDLDTGQVRLNDDHWSWEGSLPDLVERCRHNHDLTKNVQRAEIVLFMRGFADFLYGEVEIEELVHIAERWTDDDAKSYGQSIGDRFGLHCAAVNERLNNLSGLHSSHRTS